MDAGDLQEILGVGSPERRDILNNRAGVVELLFLRFFCLGHIPFLPEGKYDEADPLHGVSLAIREKPLGPGHPAWR